MGRRRPWVSWRFLEQNGWVSWSPEHSGSPVLPDVFLKSHNAENPHPDPLPKSYRWACNSNRETDLRPGVPTQVRRFRSLGWNVLSGVRGERDTRGGSPSTQPTHPEGDDPLEPLGSPSCFGDLPLDGLRRPSEPAAAAGLPRRTRRTRWTQEDSSAEAGMPAGRAQVEHRLAQEITKSERMRLKHKHHQDQWA